MKITEHIQAEAERLRLEAEIEHVESLVPHYVPFSGPPPATLDGFNALPEPWRQQVFAEHPGLVEDLQARERIKAAAAEHDAHEAKRLALLEGLPFTNNEQFEQLPQDEREEWAHRLTENQRIALAGNLPPEVQREGEAYL